MLLCLMQAASLWTLRPKSQAVTGRGRTARFMLPQTMVSLGPSVARSGITQRPVLLLCGTEHSWPMSLSYSRSVLSRPVVSTVLLPAQIAGRVSKPQWCSAPVHIERCFVHA